MEQRTVTGGLSRPGSVDLDPGDYAAQFVGFEDSEKQYQDQEPRPAWKFNFKVEDGGTGCFLSTKHVKSLHAKANLPKFLKRLTGQKISPEMSDRDIIDAITAMVGSMYTLEVDKTEKGFVFIESLKLKGKSKTKAQAVEQSAEDIPGFDDDIPF